MPRGTGLAKKAFEQSVLERETSKRPETCNQREIVGPFFLVTQGFLHPGFESRETLQGQNYLLLLLLDPLDLNQCVSISSEV